ncbi:AraC family transcriptional regulator [Paenibacillus daejeonensis]|uniref:AraC family transcriptional regulator n=1 Tax=Paenibacillus daejeonensis TaxID=135193 RepID=UPI00036D455B|nr:AraC family transcriptional regulator [Paenibacillus daejeonensis]
MLLVVSAGYSRHTKPFHSSSVHQVYLVRLQVEGHCHAFVNDTRYELGPGDLLLCKPGDSYQLHILQEPSEHGSSGDYFFGIRPDGWMAAYWGSLGERTKLHTGADVTSVSLCKTLVQERRRVNDAHPAILDGLARSLLLHLQRQAGDDQSGDVYQRRSASLIKSFVERHAAEPFKLQEAARAAGLGISRASQLFRQIYGQTIMDYAIDVRLGMAKEQMLVSGSSLQEIAEQCGFANYTHFNRLFRSRSGQSPSSYRKRLLS